jgi:hypothetical protein
MLPGPFPYFPRVGTVFGIAGPGRSQGNGAFRAPDCLVADRRLKRRSAPSPSTNACLRARGLSGRSLAGRDAVAVPGPSPPALGVLPALAHRAPAAVAALGGVEEEPAAVIAGALLETR